MPKPTTKIGGEEAILLDRVAALALAGNGALAKIREIYRDERLGIPKTVFNASRQTQEAIG